MVELASLGFVAKLLQLGMALLFHGTN